MSSGDWLRPDWFRDAVRAWTPEGMVPSSFAQVVQQAADLFGFAPAVIAREVIDAATSRLVGRRATLRAGDREVNLVLRSLRMARPPVGLMVGQLGDIELEAEDVHVGDLHLDHLRLEVRNVHVQPGPSVTIVGAPIIARGAIGPDVIRSTLVPHTDRVEVELVAGAARAYLIGRRDWGHIDLVPRIDGRTLVLEPAEVVVGRWDRLSPLVRRLPPLRVPLTDLPDTLHLTGVTVEDGRLIVDGVYEEWRAQLTPQQLDQLVRRIQRFEGGLLTIPGLDGGGATSP